MRVRAFAKINRSLRVLGTRPDGYHELRTIFQSIALHDTLTIRAIRGPFRLTCDDPACPVDDTNLIARAAVRMWRAAGRRGAPRDVAVDLRKRIPIQAGLGGGSSDGAAALRGLGKRWRVPFEKVREAAGTLGADVPYFLEGGAMLGLERGDLLFRLAEPTPSWLVLVLPDFGISTRDAFGWFDAQGARGFQPSGRGGAEKVPRPPRVQKK
jgi:4-diphosphocytidyl-2-C-methyl-D-erythritol kinase